jgi:hypothetical protein
MRHRLCSLMKGTIGRFAERGLLDMWLRLMLLGRHDGARSGHDVSGDDRFALASVCDNKMSWHAAVNL